MTYLSLGDFFELHAPNDLEDIFYVIRKGWAFAELWNVEGSYPNSDQVVQPNLVDSEPAHLQERPKKMNDTIHGDAAGDP
jgi:hypothetical protein